MDARESGARIWGLFGRRAGDNRQIATLAEAAGLPWAEKRLTFHKGRAPAWPRGGYLHSLTPESKALIAPPWPDIVIAAGKWSAPVALRIRALSGSRTKLVHIGRPWSPLGWFDLILTTPQYGLPARPNVISNTLPLTAGATETIAITDEVLALPRPRLAVLVGGDSRPLVLDAAAAQGLAETAIARATEAGGSLMVATSPRTSPEAVAVLRAALERSAAPVRLSVFGQGPNEYRAFLAGADALLVTDDSASMLTEAALTGAPVSVFPLPRRPDWRSRGVNAIRQASGATRLTTSLFERLVDWGTVTSIRDLDRMVTKIEADGLLAGGDSARRRAEAELAAAAAAVRQLAKN